MDAKHIGVLTYYLFAMLDLTDQFEDVKFRRSLFGQRLKAWSDLPDNPLIHGIWQQFPRQTTYYWFQSLQSLLFVFQNWIKNLRYHPMKGFVEAQDHQFRGHLILDSSTPSPVPDLQATIISSLKQFDTAFALRWYQTSPHDSSWTSPTPPGHFPPPPPSRQLPPLDTGVPVQKKARMQPPPARTNTQIPKDFLSTTPLLELVTPLQPNIPVSTQLLERIPRGISYPKFADPSGTYTITICFRSSFAAPNHCCATSICKERRAPRKTRLHVDLGVEPWKSKPESYWAPLVAFLVDPQISPILRPSPALIAMTPATNWK
jgi:hypothetical protein